MFCNNLLFLKTIKLKKSTVGKNKYKNVVLEKSIHEHVVNQAQALDALEDLFLGGLLEHGGTFRYSRQ